MNEKIVEEDIFYHIHCTMFFPCCILMSASQNALTKQKLNKNINVKCVHLFCDDI